MVVCEVGFFNGFEIKVKKTIFRFRKMYFVFVYVYFIF